MPFFDIENYLNYQRFTQLISKYIRIRKLEIMESVHGFFVNNVRKLKKQYEFGLLLFKGAESISWNGNIENRECLSLNEDHLKLRIPSA